MEEFGFGDDLFEQKQKNSSQDNNYEYNAKIEEALVCNPYLYLLLFIWFFWCFFFILIIYLFILFGV